MLSSIKFSVLSSTISQIASRIFFEISNPIARFLEEELFAEYSDVCIRSLLQFYCV